MSKQKLSLQEQLLKSGLVSSAKAKTAKSDKHKQAQLQRKNNVAVVDEAKELAVKAQVEKAERDRELNQLRKQQDAQKELAAQVKQLVEAHRQHLDVDGVAYHFNDQGRMKTLYVAEPMRKQLIDGRMAIVKLGQGYEIVPADVAEKISSRDAASVIVHNEHINGVEDKKDDPYAAYQIPDDLIW
ncbi:MAG: DUF2058 domain-containing protein [Methylovulum sp.]|nr:DUF2058 domain-containing protein [Methylovulum sp.]